VADERTGSCNVPLDDSAKCPNCGSAVPADVTHCAHCGEGRTAVATARPSVAAVIGLIVLGIVSALPVWFVIGMLGFGVFASLGARSDTYAPSWGATAFFVVLTLLTLAGLIVQARARLNPGVRVFAVAFLCTALGLFSICDIIGFSSGG